MRPSKQEITSLVKRYLEGKISKSDFDSFLKGLEEPEVRKIYSHTLKSSFEESLKENTSFYLNSKKQFTSHQPVKYWLGIAATFLLLASLSFLIYKQLDFNSNSDHTYYETAFAEQKKISLPDGSSIDLNVGSTLEQLPFDGQQRRRVNLTGEAFFQVAKDKDHPFEISTQSTTILVLGTAFNVFSYPEDELLEVSVTEGTVRVSLQWENYSMEEVLTIGEKISINKRKKTYEVLAFEEPIHWKSQVLNFDQTRFSQVINMLERWYGVGLEVKDSSLYELKISGQFKDKSIEEVINAIGFLANKDLESSELIQVTHIKTTQN